MDSPIHRNHRSRSDISRRHHSSYPSKRFTIPTRFKPRYTDVIFETVYEDESDPQIDDWEKLETSFNYDDIDYPHIFPQQFEEESVQPELEPVIFYRYQPPSIVPNIPIQPTISNTTVPLFTTSNSYYQYYSQSSNYQNYYMPSSTYNFQYPQQQSNQYPYDSQQYDQNKTSNYQNQNSYPNQYTPPSTYNSQYSQQPSNTQPSYPYQQEYSSQNQYNSQQYDKNKPLKPSKPPKPPKQPKQPKPPKEPKQPKSKPPKEPKQPKNPKKPIQLSKFINRNCIIITLIILAIIAILAIVLGLIPVYIKAANKSTDNTNQGTMNIITNPNTNLKSAIFKRQMLEVLHYELDPEDTSVVVQQIPYFKLFFHF